MLHICALKMILYLTAGLTTDLETHWHCHYWSLIAPLWFISEQSLCRSVPRVNSRWRHFIVCSILDPKWSWRRSDNSKSIMSLEVTELYKCQQVSDDKFRHYLIKCWLPYQIFDYCLARRKNKTCLKPSYHYRVTSSDTMTKTWCRNKR